MRTEEQVLDQLINFANKNDRIRCVLQNGSRVNPNVKKDLFCDYDVVYVVDDPDYFLNNQEWIKEFGELIIHQQNDFEVQGIKSYIFLMIFDDGVRIDLSIIPLSKVNEREYDSLEIVLLDKDHIINELPAPTDTCYHVKRPTQEEYDHTINEILWCSTYVAKGIWRDELTLTKFIFESVIRPCVIRLLKWHIGSNNEWSVNPGKVGKWFKQFLSKDMYEQLVRTYPDSDYGHIWEALFELLDLTNHLGIELANHLDFYYPIEDEKRVMIFLRKIQTLPKDAKSIF